MYESRVLFSVSLASVRDTGNPEFAEVSLTISSISVRVLQRSINCLFGKLVGTCPVPLHAFNLLKNLLMLAMLIDTFFYSHISSG